jgi:transcriptional regulator with XRE-family HTH domain
MIDRTQLGVVLDMLRIRHKLTKAELAERVDAGPGNLSKMLKGDQEITLARLNAFADVFDIPVHEIMRLAEERSPSKPRTFKRKEISVLDQRRQVIYALVQQYDEATLQEVIDSLPVQATPLETLSAVNDFF